MTSGPRGLDLRSIQTLFNVGSVAGMTEELLRERLTRRGLSPSVVIAPVHGMRFLSNALPHGLAESTMNFAKHAVTGKAMTAGVVPSAFANLTEGVVHTMTIKKLTIAATTLLVAGIGASSVGWLAIRAARAHPNPAVAEQAQNQPSGAAAAANGKEEIRARQRSGKNLRTIALAMYNYSNAAVDNRFPEAATIKDDKPLLSWRVALLPHLGQQALYDKFRLDQPWDSAQNKALVEQIPEVYSPVIPRGEPKGYTYYQVFSGEGAMFDGSFRPILSDIFDGPAQTAMVVEAGKAVPWTKPEDVPFDKDKPLPKLGGEFGQGLHVLFADGSVMFLSKKIEEKTLRALITPRGSDAISRNQLPVIPPPRPEKD
ncbi:MAG: DUF1559 domain-containing protein [Isosphaerales bacterium]